MERVTLKCHCDPDDTSGEAISNRLEIACIAARPLASSPRFTGLLAMTVIFSFLFSTAFASEKLNIAVTIAPQAEFVEKVGGEYVNVSVMVPAAGNPHTYELTPSQLKDARDADLYFKLGSGIEFELMWMDKIASINNGLTIIDNSAGITLIDNEDKEAGHLPGAGHYHGPKDPHIWLSPKNAAIMINTIKNALIAGDPEHVGIYQKNAEAYINELNGLDREIREELKDKKKRVFMVFHPAWAYFARDYGLKEIAIESEGKEPTIAGLRGIIDTARENGIKVIFISPQFSRRSAEVVAKEAGCKIAVVDDLSKDYTGNMRCAAGVLKEGID